MQKDQQKLIELIKGKKVAFIGAGVSHKTLIKEFVEMGAHVTLCDQKKSVEDFGDYAATIKELGIDLNYNVEIETASVLTKSADVRALSEEAQKLFALTARAADQYVLAYPELRAARGSSAWTEGPVIV